MCTVILNYRPDHRWPLLIAGNRDEMRDRPALSPGSHWPEHANTVAGLDQLAGGSWLGMNRNGVVSIVMNRMGTLGPIAGKRSRGVLVLQALDHPTAHQAATALSAITPQDYRAFNLLVSDAQGCYWVKNPGENISPRVELLEIPPGLHMLTAHELDDDASPRIRTWLSRFIQAKTPEPNNGDWQSWIELISSRASPADLGPEAAMNVDLPSGLATVSSTLIALPAKANSQQPIWLFADGAPDKAPFKPINV